MCRRAQEKLVLQFSSFNVFSFCPLEIDIIGDWVYKSLASLHLDAQKASVLKVTIHNNIKYIYYDDKLIVLYQQRYKEEND